MKHLNRFARSAGNALIGLGYAWRSEANLRWQILAALVTLILALWLKLSLQSLAILIVTSALVIVLELLNTMVEAIIDLLKPRLNQYVKHIKDLAAAAVAVAAIASIGVAVCLILPPLLRLWWP